MSATVRQFHEEEAIGKTYDLRLARRLLKYLRPYVGSLAPALALTLVANGLGVLQPKFIEDAIDNGIMKKSVDVLTWIEVAFFDRNPVGRIMTRLTSDVDALNELFTSGVIELLGDVVVIFAVVIIMLAMDW